MEYVSLGERVKRLRFPVPVTCTTRMKGFLVVRQPDRFRIRGGHVQIYSCDWHICTRQLRWAVSAFRAQFITEKLLNKTIRLFGLITGETDKIGYTRVVSEQNRVRFFSRRGALTYVCKTPPNRLLAPELTAPSVCAAPQTVFSAFEPSKQRQ